MSLHIREGTPSFTIGATDIKKVVVGALIAAAGAGLTYLTAWVSGADFGQWTPTITAAWAVLANAVRKYLGNTTETVVRP